MTQYQLINAKVGGNQLAVWKTTRWFWYTLGKVPEEVYNMRTQG